MEKKSDHAGGKALHQNIKQNGILLGREEREFVGAKWCCKWKI